MKLRQGLLSMASALLLAAMPSVAGAQAVPDSNPFMKPYPGKYGIPPFQDIKTSDFLPAIKAGIAEQDQNILNIVRNRAVPDFDNTIMPLENLSPILDRVAGVFYHYNEALNTPDFATMADEAIPMLNDASNKLYLNAELFNRIKQVYDTRNDKGRKLTPVQKRVIEKYYRSFVEQGANLPEDKKKELVAVNNQLSKLFIQFNRNLLNANNNFYITVYDKADLSGLPESSITVAAEEAAKRGLPGLWVFTTKAPSRLPVLQNADSRSLREAMYKGYTHLAAQGEYDNSPIIAQIVKLRAEKAKIMGFDNFARMMTSRVMAKTPEAAENLLMQVFVPAVERSKEEVKEMQDYVDAHGGGFKIAPWDYYYYSDKVKQQKYNLSESELRPYFEVNNVLKGLFYAAEKLYGIKLVEMPDAPKYMNEVKVYDVQDAKTGEHIAVWMCDYFPRASKRQGAWMEQLQSAGVYEDGKYRRPIVYNVGNFTPPSADTPSLLTQDEVETTFHEFGHALQGMLSTAPYRSIAGTNVDRDFVELPSQLNEHWAWTPEVMAVYARHYKTGEIMPDSLMKKMQAASKHNQGFITTELAAAALLDLNWGRHNGENVNVPEFEAAVAEKIGLPAEITYRYRSPYFKHIFGDDGYASGYYTYLWSQVLEADAWELFQKKGIFDPKTAASYKKNILQAGDTEDPTVLFKRFSGHDPDPKALLRLRGLIAK